MDPTLAALPLGSPQTDTIHQIVDMVLDRAILLCAGRPLLSFALPIVKGAIDALWPTIFPEAKAALAAKGITITKA